MAAASPLTIVSSLLRSEILNLNAYHVPDSNGLIKLDAMENPYVLPESLQSEIAEIAAKASFNRYPDPGAAILKEKIRSVTGLPQGLDVMLGNGSDELIQLLALALNKPNATMLSLEPAFVMYRMIATFTGMRYVGVPLKEDFSLDLQATLKEIEKDKPALIFLAFPNNPTGNLFSMDDIERIIEASSGLVVVDEAYYAFASESFISKLEKYPNLLVMRTFSKLGMAGLRLGFLAGDSVWLDQLEKLRLPYNVGVLTQKVAGVLLDNHGVLLEQAEKIKTEREKLFLQLGEIGTLKVYPSEANFILFRVENATEVFNGLKRHGVLIKNLDGGHAALKDCLRVTVGTPEENKMFMTALKETITQTALGQSSLGKNHA